MRGLTAIVIAMCAVLGGCASTPESVAANDPLEPMNRAVFKVNEKFDRYIELPIAGFYIFYMPTPFRQGIDNFSDNLNMPIVFANDVLQGEVNRAAKSLGRFVVNTTLGMGGFVDAAARIGLPYRPTDFGTTLARYGVGEGPFLVLPIIGPEPPRDLVGDAVDLGGYPLTYLPMHAPVWARATAIVAVGAIGPLETNARNIFLRQELEKSSVDPYATMRSVYRQIRRSQIEGDDLPPDDTANK
jgi:phospholipid-binding lipoprotein MlaA